MVAQTGSVYSTLCVTIERYIVICWPLRYAESITNPLFYLIFYSFSRSTDFISYGRTKLAIFFIFLFSLAYNFSRFFEVTWKEVPVQGTNETSVSVFPTPMRENTIYVTVYITWMYLVFMYALPFGGLSVLNTLMYLDVRQVVIDISNLPIKI